MEEAMDYIFHITVHAYAEEKLNDSILTLNSRNYGIIDKRIITPFFMMRHFRRKNQNDKNTFYLPRQGERTTECVVKSRAELGIVRQS